MASKRVDITTHEYQSVWISQCMEMYGIAVVSRMK